MTNRLFLAVDISAVDKARLTQWRENHLPAFKKTIPSSNYHITLVFLGSVDSTTQKTLLADITQLADFQTTPKSTLLNSASKNTVKISLLLDHLALFNKPKVLYLTATSVPVRLNNLASSLTQMARSLKIIQQSSQQSNHYIPHISIARKINLIPECNIFQVTVNLSTFSLYESISTPAGVQYSAIQTWPLL